MKYKDIQFRHGTTFLVTGGAGFIGSNLCEELIRMGYNVRCLDNLFSGKMQNIESVLSNSNFTFIKGDIRDYDTCLKATDSVDFVLHQAGIGSVPRSIEMPLLYNEVNIRGTLNMMEASRISKVRKFVYASSSSVYGDSIKLPKLEGEEGRVLSPYALTKKVNEEYGRFYSELYGLDTYGLRYFNVFGRRQNPSGAYAAVIPKFINQILNGESPTINGDGRQSRDFTYVENVIDANIKSCVAPSDYSGEAFNIASGGRIEINEVFQILCKLLNRSIEPVYGPYRIGDVKHSNADISKAQRCLGYTMDYSFENGLYEYINSSFLGGQK